jgi:hypothetical protein
LPGAITTSEVARLGQGLGVGTGTDPGPGAIQAQTKILAPTVGIGTETNPQAPLVVSANALAGIALPATVAGPYAIGVDAGSFGWNVLSFGGNPQTNYLKADGTAAAPSIIGSVGDNIGVQNFYGYVSPVSYVATVGFRVRSTAAWTASSAPAYCEWRTTPPNSTSFGVVMTLGQGLQLGAGNPSTLDPGKACLMLQPQAFAGLGAPAAARVGSFAVVNDSTVTAVGATIAGGGTNTVLACCGLTKWSVAALLT